MSSSTPTLDPDHVRLLAEAAAFAQRELAHDSSGHDWSHIERVAHLARHIAAQEHADAFICELAALLHDIADYKIAGDEATGLRRLHDWFATQAAPAATVERVMDIITTMSFGGGARPPMATLEGRIVQDADRLDAIGAIGVARAFAYGGAHGRPLHTPDQPPQTFASRAAYQANTGSTINHFYEKLLLLKDRMNTPYARQLAEHRHRVMQQFLDDFHAEWAGER